MALYTALPDGVYELVGLEVEVVFRGRLTQASQSGNLYLAGPEGDDISLNRADGGPVLVEVRRAPLVIEVGELYQDDSGSLFVGEGDHTVHPYGLPTVIRRAMPGLRHVKVVKA